MGWPSGARRDASAKSRSAGCTTVAALTDTRLRSGPVCVSGFWRGSTPCISAGRAACSWRGTAARRRHAQSSRTFPVFPGRDVHARLCSHGPGIWVAVGRGTKRLHVCVCVCCEARLAAGCASITAMACYVCRSTPGPEKCTHLQPLCVRLQRLQGRSTHTSTSADLQVGASTQQQRTQP
jgi:hypothetical protein